MWKSKALGAITVVGALAAFVGWEFVVKANIEKGRAYRGVIEETYRKRAWLRSRRTQGFTRQPSYDYYWKVRCDDGEVRNIELPHGRWNEGQVGDPVVKVKGERWPYVDTEEAAELRALRREVLDAAIQGVQKRLLGKE
ncbi:MAG TPA: hypothetical protein ENN80_04265 [Candidatus Hydrogenedentes bacterium]|nr:hypothetical protein [Candidatus Hydrogenedentota bacterium]